MATPEIRPKGEFVSFERRAIEQSIVERFEQQAAARAGRLAVKTRNLELTFAELNECANRIAWAILEKRGEQPEPVALLMKQGARLIAAILGILKAGKFYVPLDPDSPRPHLKNMLEHSQASLIVDEEFAGAAARDGPANNPGLAVTPDAYAYIYYTSGSTGAPKAVVDIHRNVLHNVMRYTNGLLIGPDDRLTLLQSASFSGAVSSLFGALLNGASVFPFDVRNEGAGALAGWAREHRITMFHSVPALFRHLVSGEGFFPDVRVIRLEGDQAYSTDAGLYQRHFSPSCILVNGLGLTETGIIRRYALTKESKVRNGPLPVGYPVEDMEVRILGDDGREVSTGEAGEIIVRSRYLAAGYWRRPELTSERFLACDVDPDLRVYKTGDVGRMRPDGCLEHLGRKDFEVKIRGQRVEVEEVEGALTGLSGIREAVVRVVGAESGDPRLAAYIVPSGGRKPHVVDLRRALATRLPAYLIPSDFVTLDSLPLNANGKVDRRALPDPGESEALYIAPRDGTEATLEKIWCSVLKRARVGVRSDFFELGGHSLQAMAMLGAVKEVFGRDIPVSALLETPTIEQLARVLCGCSAPHRGLLVPLRTGGTRPPLFCVHPANGHVLIYRELALNLDEDQPVYGIRAAGIENDETLLGRVEEMASRYVDEMRAVQRNGPYFLAGHCFGALVALAIAIRLQQQGDQVALLASLSTDFRSKMLRGPREALRVHFEILTRLGAWQRLRYLSERVRYRSERMANTAIDALCRMRLAAGGRLPPAWNMRHILERNHAAGKQYRPGVYNGRVAYFHGSGDVSKDPRVFWDTVATEGVRVHTVPGEDAGILKGPNAAALAKVLRRCLNP